jgi:hypothetical protein
VIKRKVTILTAVVATLASSAVGATLLRSPDASADLEVDVGEVVSVSREELDTLPEATLNVVPASKAGVGETLVLVVAAQVPSDQADKAVATANAHFGDLEGFSADSASAYELTGGYVHVGPDTVDVPCGGGLECPDGLTVARELQAIDLQFVPLDALTSFALIPQQSLIVTGFRTKQGAEEFLELARAAGVTGLVTVQARKVGGGDIGLGQEPHPDGSGPLLGPLANQELYQR